MRPSATGGVGGVGALADGGAAGSGKVTKPAATVGKAVPGFPSAACCFDAVLWSTAIAASPEPDASAKPQRRPPRSARAPSAAEQLAMSAAH
jgi:hypothetical protein